MRKKAKQSELDMLERDARRPDYGGKYYKPGVVLAVIEELKETRLLSLCLMIALAKSQQPVQWDLFDTAERDGAEGKNETIYLSMQN